MSIDEPFHLNQRMWSPSIDRQWDIFLVQGIENDTPAARRRSGIYFDDPYWSMDHVIVTVRRPARSMPLRRHIETRRCFGTNTTPAGSP